MSLATQTDPPRNPPAITTPIDAGERLHALDILRGMALLGMILVHFHQRIERSVEGPEGIIAWIIWIAVEQKAWGAFALLFGVGFAVLLRRLEVRGAPVVPLYLRRLAALALFGFVAEAFFGFHVLLEYAIWGVPLLFIRRWSTRALLAVAVLAVVARPAFYAVQAAWEWSAYGSEGAASVAAARNAPALALWNALDAARQEGSYWALLQARVGYMSVRYGHYSALFPSSFVLFVIGFLAVRHGVLDEPRRHARLIVAWMSFGAIAFALYWLVLRNIPTLPIPRMTWTVRFGFGLLQDQWLTFTYAGALLLMLAYRQEWMRRLSLVGLAGRMALTNYLLQAAVVDYLGSGYGLSLRLRPGAVLVATLLLFGTLALFSRWWLHRFRFGPAEWLWRSLTYLRRQPLRHQPLDVPRIAQA